MLWGAPRVEIYPLATKKFEAAGSKPELTSGCSSATGAAMSGKEKSLNGARGEKVTTPVRVWLCRLAFVDWFASIHDRGRACAFTRRHPGLRDRFSDVMQGWFSVHGNWGRGERQEMEMLPRWVHAQTSAVCSVLVSRKSGNPPHWGGNSCFKAVKTQPPKQKMLPPVPSLVCVSRIRTWVRLDFCLEEKV